jgi:hypothetical protein
VAGVPRDPTRGQLAVEDLVPDLEATYPEAADPNHVVIAVLRGDIYTKGRPDWRFVFRGGDDHVGVVSTARMHAAIGPFGDLVEAGRLRKMVTRSIGFLYYGIPFSVVPQSVLYVQLLGVSDIDRMGDDFDPTLVPLGDLPPSPRP